MAIKRRLSKAAGFNEYHRGQLINGPKSELLAGVGYLAIDQIGTFDGATAEQQATILGAMELDWQRHGRKLMAETSEPIWAKDQFGELTT